MKRLVAVAALMLAGSAGAEPVYLTCTAKDGQSSSETSWSLDEATSRASKDGRSYEATFGPAEILIVDIDRGPLVTFIHRTKINRQDLTFEYEIKASSDDGVKSISMTTGTCKVIAAPERKI